ncbi:conjugal transfer protein TraF [Marinomonas aquiplantarum]|uniref:F plasmid transfer operon protein TraF n=1 Tax=Marinomonas aquiplantarum TaxID=491951 RepID=A0A366D612_9GAMM|nr:conjugal transfer protein TraF [Marinomonas aquiplantarum]RBO84949.1 F plasmid transfer operon protein TraF [Marinomonas aquiplantarum]
MKKLLVLSTSLLSTAAMAAMPVNQPIGSSFTLSSSPNKRALATALANPAAPFLMVNEQDDDNFRFGILGPLSIGIEMGDVSDLGDRMEEIEDIIDNSTAGTAAGDVTRVENILNEVGDTAYVKTSVGMQVPLMPVIYKTDNNGAFMLDASISSVAKANVLSSDVSVDGGTGKLTTDASFQAQTAVDLALGLGYSQSMWENSHGMLVGGLKATMHNISMGRALVSLEDESTDADDAISDAVDEDAVDSTGVGIDLGMVWVSNNYQVGVTFANINEPEFDGVAIDTACGSESCDAAQSLQNAGKLDASGSKYVMEMQTTVDLALSTSGKQFTLGMSYDTNPVKDAVGDEYQWAAASLSYYGDSHFLPGLRVGYRQNMAGTELSYGSFGLTILKRLNLDVAVALDTVEDEDGDEMPRSVYFALGYDTAF